MEKMPSATALTLTRKSWMSFIGSRKRIIMSSAKLEAKSEIGNLKSAIVMSIQLKRAYDKPSVSDGARVLVDRLWPRGVPKQKAAIDEWLRDLAPSDALRHWYHTNSLGWNVFRK